MPPHSRVRGWRVISRYTRPEIGAVWSQQRKLECWLEVELAATEAWAEEGVVPVEAAEAARASAAFTVEAVPPPQRGPPPPPPPLLPRVAAPPPPPPPPT